MALHFSRLATALFLGVCIMVTTASMPGSASALTIVSATPKGEVRDLSQITVRFSEPMRALGVMNETGATSPLKLTARDGSLPAGNFRWLDPSTLAYIFTAPVARPVHIKVVAPKETKALSGAALAADEAWEVFTPALDLTVPGGDALPKKGATVTLLSNYQLDTKVLREKARLSTGRKGLSYTLDDPYPANYSQGRPTGWGYTFTIKENLPANSTVKLTLAGGVTARDGGEGAQAMAFSLPTYENLRLLGFEIPDRRGQGGRETVPPEESLRLSFNNPVQYKDLLRHVSVSPAARLPEKDDMPSDMAGSDLFLPYKWEPRTPYTVTLKRGLRDSFGTTLGETATFSFTTGDYSPLLYMPGGRKVMETPLAHMYPMHLRNVGKGTLRLRYLPWDETAFELLREDREIPSETFRTIPGARETMVVLDVTDRPNRNIREMADIPAALGLRLPEETQGLFLVDIVRPEEETLQANENLARMYDRRLPGAKLQVTDLGVVLRMGAARGLAWVTGITDGKPVAGAAVRLADKNGKTVWRGGTTDNEGLAELPGYGELSGEARFCVVSKNADVSVLDMVSHGMPESGKAFSERESRAYPWRVHAVTQLPLYQPGQQVNGTLFAREFVTDDKGNAQTESPAGDPARYPTHYPNWRAVAGENVTLTVEDRMGRMVHTAKGITNAYGSIPFAFTLADDATPGTYRIKARAETARPVVQAIAYPFTVASFRPPDFKVDVTVPADQPHPPQTKDTAKLEARVMAGYFSGASLPGAEVILEGEASAAWFAPARLAGYRTGPDWDFFRRHAYEPPQTFTQTGKLDAEGERAFALPRIKKQRGRPLSVQLTATVADEARLTTQGTAAFMLHPGEYYIGIRAPFLALQNKPAKVELRGATWDNKALTGVPVTLTAERVTYVVKDGVSKTRTETAWKKEIPLAAESGDSLDVTFDRGGTYILTASVLDKAGRENIASARVYVPGAGMEWIRDRRTLNLEFLAEEKEYAPGETALIAVKNPFDAATATKAAPVTALVTIERPGILRTMRMDVSGPAPVISIPLEKGDAPYVHATVILIKGRAAPPPAITAPDGARDDGAPAMAQGGVLLRVSGVSKSLSVAVTTDAEEYRPGEKVTAKARVTDTSGKGREAQVTFLAVDERVLRAAGEQTSWDLSQTFRPLYPQGVYGAFTLRDILNRSLPDLAPAMYGMAMAGEARMASPAQAPKTGNGLDMATAAGSNQESVSLRSNFTPLAFWLAAGETDASGNLTATFTLPDTLTGYRVVAVAADKGGSFSKGETSIRANKPLQLLSALPKFVTEGDKLEAAVLVQNTGGQTGTVTVTAEAMGATLAVNTRDIRLEPGRSGTVYFPLTAPLLTGNEGSFTFRAVGRMGDETDAVEYAVPVLPARPVTYVAAAGTLAEGGRFTLPVKAPSNLDPRSRLDVIFAPSPAAGAPLAALQVIEYPWNCLEQRLSRTWARILRISHGNLVGLAPDATDQEKIAEDMAAVAKLQEQDGSFALWPGMRAFDRDNLFLTAYALVVSNEAKAVNSALPGDAMDRALGYIEKTLAKTQAQTGKTANRSSGGSAGRTDGQPGDLPGNQAGGPAPEAAALGLRVLAAHRPDAAARLLPGVLAYCEAAETNPLGWGALVTAVKALAPENAGGIQSRILERLEKTAVITPTEMHFASARDTGHWRTLGSTLRDNGMLLAALSRAVPDYPRLEALARWVGQSLGDRKFLSTQEAVFGFRGLTRYLVDRGGDRETKINALWNNKDEASVLFARIADQPVTWSIPQAKLNAGGDSRLDLTAVRGNPYWTARMAYASPDLPTNVENAGFTVVRAVSETGKAKDTRKAKGARKAEGSYALGDTLEVTLTLTVPATRRHVLLYDPFPAGFEPLYASRVDVADREKTWQPPWQWQDALDHGMLLYSPVAHPGVYTYTYTLRAAAAGTFVQRATQVEEMYTPEVFGRTGMDAVVITAQ